MTPTGTRRFEIICANPTAALARARTVPTVRDATMFGDTLHILIDDTVSTESLLAQIAAGDPSASARPIAPTLEDAFVILSRQHARDAA